MRVSGGEEVGEDNVTEWLVCDENDHSFDSMISEQIVKIIKRWKDILNEEVEQN